MDQTIIKNVPEVYSRIVEKSKEIGFTMPSDIYIGSFLKTLIASKPKANILELGTGIGLSLSWMIDGMDGESRLISVDNDPELIKNVKSLLEDDPRVEIICEDGSKWIKTYNGDKFDVIFADAWPGKYSAINEILDLIQVGGFYIIDDMVPQPNWPEGHEKNVKDLIQYLENRKDITLTKMNWSTGVILAVKK